jgi:carbonic anhydrase
VAHGSIRGFSFSSNAFDPQLTPEAMLAQAVEVNVRWTMRQILETPEGRERQVEGRVKLVGAIYEIETGLVRFLE